MVNPNAAIPQLVNAIKKKIIKCQDYAKDYEGKPWNAFVEDGAKKLVEGLEEKQRNLESRWQNEFKVGATSGSVPTEAPLCWYNAHPTPCTVPATFSPGYDIRNTSARMPGWIDVRNVSRKLAMTYQTRSSIRAKTSWPSLAYSPTAMLRFVIHPENGARTNA